MSDLDFLSFFLSFFLSLQAAMHRAMKVRMTRKLSMDWWKRESLLCVCVSVCVCFTWDERFLLLLLFTNRLWGSYKYKNKKGTPSSSSSECKRRKSIFGIAESTSGTITSLFLVCPNVCVSVSRCIRVISPASFVRSLCQKNKPMTWLFQCACYSLALSIK